MRSLHRRDLLRGAAGCALSAALGACRTAGGRAAPAAAAPAVPSAPPGASLAAPAPLPTPDLSDARVLRYVAGLRPFRRGGVRLEREELAGRLVVHDYGHGGSGVTLSWGCADDVLALVAAERAPPEPVLVLGAGVSGLTSAHRLASAGFRVRVLAREFPPHTTSDLAGAQWAPSLVEEGDGPEERARFDRWLRRSHAAFAALEGEAYGVFRRPNYTTLNGGTGLRAIPRDLIPPVEELERLPFEGPSHRGQLFHTFLIEPPRYLPALLRDLAQRGVTCEEGELARLSDALAEPERVIVNALGLGAGAVAGDAAVLPLRGQLVHLEPESLGYLLSHDGYLFPRSDALVVGGTVERGVADPRPDPETCRRLLSIQRRFFGLPG
jgi:D-amino-acid oxidase